MKSERHDIHSAANQWVRLGTYRRTPYKSSRNGPGEQISNEDGPNEDVSLALHKSSTSLGLTQP